MRENLPEKGSPAPPPIPNALVIPAAAGEFGGEGGELAVEERLHGLTDGGIIARIVDGNARLLEAHERTHTHATGEERGYAV